MKMAKPHPRRPAKATHETLCAWRARIERDEDGHFLVRFPDFPEALTDGASIEEALTEASDALSVALMQRLKRGEAVPPPSAARRGDYHVAPEPTVALKYVLRVATRGVPAPATTLASRLDIDHKEARRLLDPEFPSKVPRLNAALHAFGLSTVVGVYDASKRERILRTR
jgi:antitoxin HicB